MDSRKQQSYIDTETIDWRARSPLQEVGYISWHQAGFLHVTSLGRVSPLQILQYTLVTIAYSEFEYNQMHA